MNELYIISTDAAIVWQREVDQLNHETEQLLKDVGKALQDVQDGADSTIVDDIVKWGNQIVDGSGKIFEGMTQIFNVVSDLVNKVNEVLEKGKGIIGNIVKSITSM